MKHTFCIAQSSKELDYIFSKISQKTLPTVIPLDMEVQLYCRKNNLDFVDPIKFIPKNHHLTTIIHSKKLIDKIKVPKIVPNSIKLEYLHHIRFRFHSIAFVVNLLRNINKKLKIKKIYISGDYKFFGMRNKFNVFLSDIILNQFQKNKIINLGKKSNKIDIGKNLFYYKIPTTINSKKFIFFPDIGYNFIRFHSFLFKKKINITTFTFKTNQIIYKNSGFFFKLIASLKEFLFSFFYRIKYIGIKKNGSFKGKLVKLDNIRYRYETKDISYLLNKEKNYIELELSDELLKFKSLNNFISKSKPKLIISNVNTGFYGSVFDIGKINRISTLCVPHGTVSRSYNKYDKIYKQLIAEAIIPEHSTYLSIQSNIANDFTKKIKHTGKLIKTGNLLFSNNTKKDHHFKKNILYAVTNKQFHNSQLIGVESFYEFLSNLSLLEKISIKFDKKIIVKLHPSIYFCENLLKKNYPQLIFSSEKISNILKKCFVLISFSSTVIEDALCSEVPVILFDRWKRYKHCESELKPKKINQPIYYVQSRKDLITCVNTIKKSDNINFEKVCYKGSVKQNIQKLFNQIIK